MVTSLALMAVDAPTVMVVGIPVTATLVIFTGSGSGKLGIAFFGQMKKYLPVTKKLLLYVFSVAVALESPIIITASYPSPTFSFTGSQEKSAVAPLAPMISSCASSFIVILP